jgi:hypothetical protein
MRDELKVRPLQCRVQIGGRGGRRRSAATSPAALYQAVPEDLFWFLARHDGAPVARYSIANQPLVNVLGGERSRYYRTGELICPDPQWTGR